MSTRKRAGLTLIELLVAAALFAVLGTMLFQMVRGALDIWSTGERNRELSERATAAFELLTEDLRSFWPGVPGEAEQDARFLCEWREQDVDGDGRPDLRVPLLRFSRLLHEAAVQPWLAAAGDVAGGELDTSLQRVEDPSRLLPTSGLAESLYTLARLPGRRETSLVRRVRSPLGGAGSLLDPALAEQPDRLLVDAVPVADEVLYFGVACLEPGSLAWEAGGEDPGESGAPPGERAAEGKAAPGEDGARGEAIAPVTWDSTVGGHAAAERAAGAAPAPDSLLDRRDDAFPRLVRLTVVLSSGDPERSGAALAEELTAGARTFVLRAAGTLGDEQAPDHVLVDDEWMRVTRSDGSRLSVERGARGTLAKGHAAGARVRAGRRFDRVVEIPAAREVLKP